MDPAARKTALFFHAKDDLPEVRREVFKLLRTFGGRARVAVRRKAVLADDAKDLFAHGYTLQDNVTYDDLVRWFFQGLIAKNRDTLIAFARPGKSDRLAALSKAIDHVANGDTPSPGGTRMIHASQPVQTAGLQVIDYYLWAVQRLFERGEDRSFNILAGDFDLIMDLDDKRRYRNGEWYNNENRLDIAKTRGELASRIENPLRIYCAFLVDL